jgi:protocatechuate 3,4-dioxygenase beta subunit
MKDLDQYAITEAALAQMANTPDPHLKQIMECAVHHLHAFAREVELTPQEWLAGVAFLTAVGQTCTPHRQEFILLSDVLGLSRLVDVMHDAKDRNAAATETSLDAAGTESSLLGPFFREQAPAFALGDSIARHAKAGEEIVHFGRVLDAEGKGVPNAEIDVWQTDAEGQYDLQAHDPSVMDMRGRFATDAEGRYHFRTLKPLGYTIPMDGLVGDLVRRQARHGYRPAHIHFLVAAPGQRELVTALYFAEDEHIDSDTVFGVSGSLVVSARRGLPDAPRPDLPAVRYDFRLSPAADAEAAARHGPG